MRACDSFYVARKLNDTEDSIAASPMPANLPRGDADVAGFAFFVDGKRVDIRLDIDNLPKLEQG